ncbi:MAG: hypothetical protein ACI4XM_06855 [Candidatus Coprovivens sp.]
MFLYGDVLEFINRIINQSKDDDKDLIKQNIIKFKDYLELTKMVSSVTLDDIDIIVDCLDELMALKNKLGDIDVTMILQGREEEKDTVRKLGKTRQTAYDDKHYKHYQRDTSSSCGGCSPSYRSC